MTAIGLIIFLLSFWWIVIMCDSKPKWRWQDTVACCLMFGGGGLFVVGVAIKAFTLLWEYFP